MYDSNKAHFKTCNEIVFEYRMDGFSGLIPNTTMTIFYIDIS